LSGTAPDCTEALTVDGKSTTMVANDNGSPFKLSTDAPKYSATCALGASGHVERK
jgi:hypothetical protein